MLLATSYGLCLASECTRKEMSWNVERSGNLSYFSTDVEEAVLGLILLLHFFVLANKREILLLHCFVLVNKREILWNV